MTNDQTTPTRRTVMSAAALAGVAGSLAACGSDAAQTASSAAGAAQSAAGAVQSAASAAVGAAGKAIAALTDIPVGGAVIKEVDGKKIALAQPEAGKVVAFSGLCTHQGCAVAAKGAELVCPCHGSAFDAATGAVKTGPATKPLPAVAVKVSADGVTLG